MDSLFDLLGQKDFDEPAEIAAIKKYVLDTFHTEVGVQVRERDIIILVPGAALASRLRYDVQALKSAAQTTKRVSFRITSQS